MNLCVNCHILLRPNTQSHEYFMKDLSLELVSITEVWCGREVTDSDRLCQECVSLIIKGAANCSENYQPKRQVGHECVCVRCGISLIKRTKRRRHGLLPSTQEWNYIENDIFPRQIPDDAWVCHACWMRAYGNCPVRPGALPILMPEEPRFDAVEHPKPQQVEVQHSEPSSSVLPSPESDSWAAVGTPLPQPNQYDIEVESYRRTSDTSNRCFVPDCNEEECHRVPRYLKRAILAEQKIFITENARVCSTHFVKYNWEMLNDYDGFINRFNGTQIKSMLELLSSVPTKLTLDFENIDHSNDTQCHN